MSTDYASPFTFGALPTGDQPSPTIAETRAALVAHPGAWTVVLRADRAARAETYATAVNDGTKFGPGFRAEVRKEGPVFRVFASYSVGRSLTMRPSDFGIPEIYA